MSSFERLGNQIRGLLDKGLYIDSLSEIERLCISYLRQGAERSSQEYQRDLLVFGFLCLIERTRRHLEQQHPPTRVAMESIEAALTYPVRALADSIFTSADPDTISRNMHRVLMSYYTLII